MARSVLFSASIFLAVTGLGACSGSSSDDDEADGSENGGNGASGGSAGRSSGAGQSGSVGGSGNSGGSGAAGSAGLPQDPCVAGESCACPTGQSNGVTTCDSGLERCACEQCEPLELVSVPAVQTCESEPFGTWRLTKLEFGTGDLVLSTGGVCDVTVTLGSEETPRILIELEDGGTGAIYGEPYGFSQSWSEACVTSRAPDLACEEAAGSQLLDCELDCDTCSCTAYRSERYGTMNWERTLTGLELNLFGNETPTTYAYCVTDDWLSLSADGQYMEFERVYTLATPEPCSEREQDECTLGTGCTQGACVGESECSARVEEGTCLTVQGCSWDVAACAGNGQGGCGLGDFGVVPGCDFVDGPLRCAGERPACDSYDESTCPSHCQLTEQEGCLGGSIGCGEFLACPSGYCDTNDGCFGTTSCEARTSEERCNQANDNLPEPRCTWTVGMLCTGEEPTPCSSYTPEQCGFIEGCSLEPAE